MDTQCTYLLRDFSCCPSSTTPTTAPLCHEHHIDLRERDLAAREAALAARQTTTVADLERRIHARDAELTRTHANFATRTHAIHFNHNTELRKLRDALTEKVRELQRQLVAARMSAGMLERERDAARAGGLEDNGARGTRWKAEDREGEDESEEEDDGDGVDEEERRRYAKRVRVGGFRGFRGGADDEKSGVKDGQGGKSADPQTRGEAATSRGGDAAEVGEMLDGMNLGQGPSP